MEHAPWRLATGHLCLDQTQSLTEAEQTYTLSEQILARLRLDGTTAASDRYQRILIHAAWN